MTWFVQRWGDSPLYRWAIRDENWITIAEATNEANAKKIVDALNRSKDIRDTLRECRGNKTAAAAALGISRSTLYRRLLAFKEK